MVHWLVRLVVGPVGWSVCSSIYWLTGVGRSVGLVRCVPPIPTHTPSVLAAWHLLIATREHRRFSLVASCSVLHVWLGAGQGCLISALYSASIPAATISTISRTTVVASPGVLFPGGKVLLFFSHLRYLDSGGVCSRWLRQNNVERFVCNISKVPTSSCTDALSLKENAELHACCTNRPPPFLPRTPETPPVGTGNPSGSTKRKALLRGAG